MRRAPRRQGAWCGARILVPPSRGFRFAAETPGSRMLECRDERSALIPLGPDLADDGPRSIGLGASSRPPAN
jgi:hypothetical protein